MSFEGITGHCATVAFTGLADAATWIARLISIGEITFSTESVADNDICTTFGRYIPGDITEGDPVALTCVFDPTSNLPKTGDKGSVVITWPKQSSESVANQANLDGQCIIEVVSISETINNERVTATLTFRWNGLSTDGNSSDGPEYTPETEVVGP